MADTDYVIETADLTKVYKRGNVLAVNKLNLHIKKGEIYALIGANGSGKTTTINMLTGALYPTSGSVKILNYSIPKERKKVARHIGVAPQEYSVYLDLTVKENIAFFANIYGMPPENFEKRLFHLLGILRLEEKADVLAKDLSGGMKRRLSIACALIHDPQIVFFDEATVGVDPVLRLFFWDYFRKLRDNGKTIIITSHVMDEAERADRIGLMREGILIDEGEPSALKAKYEVDTIEEVFLKVSYKVKNNE